MSPHLPPAGDPPDLLAAGSLPARWAHLAAVEPDRMCVYDDARGWTTRGELEGPVPQAVAGRLYGAGLRKGDRVVVSAPASTDLVVAHVACLRLGLIVVPANGAYRRRELAAILDDAGPRAVVFDDPTWHGRAAEDAPDALRLTSAIDLADDRAPGLDLVSPGDPALIGYTSGTTGRPKGAVLSHGNLLAGAEALRLAWHWTPEDRLALALPLFHMHGLGVGLHGTLNAGASAVLFRRFDPELVLSSVRRHGITLFFGVPTMYRRLVDATDPERLAAVRLCVSGSAPMSPDLHRRVAAVAGQDVLERYGMTETVMLTSNPHDGERRPGTVGFPLPGVEVQLVSDGEVQVRGSNVFRAYWRRPEATEDAFDDGWFHTGDVGELDDDGYLRLVGRSKELIITGGMNVHPREVEEAVAELPEVSEAAVAGMPSDEWGEQVTVWIVASDGADLSELSCERLRSRLGTRLAPYKLPRSVHFIEELPRNALGKLQRHRLAGGPNDRAQEDR